jgi:hypothetical protein
MAFKFNPFTGTLDEVSTSGGGSTSPGGSTTQVQFNDAGAFAGDADLTWNKTTNVLGITGDVNLSDGGTYTTTLQTITPTAARTISFPNSTGTVGLVGGSSGNLVVNQSGAYVGVANSSVDNATGDITLGSRFISSLNGAASAPPGAFTGTWFTGGTATTTKPQVLIEPTGATSTAWSTAGTALGVNASSGFAGNLLDLQVNGTSKLKIADTGSITSTGGATFNSAVNITSSYLDVSNGFIYHRNRVAYDAPATGVITISTNATGDFNRLQFGGTTTSFPALKRNGAVLETKLADDSAYARHAASVFQVATALTVATLPGTPAVGMVARVTDATAPAVGTTVAGGGAAAALCWYNGASWSVIGV